MKVEEQLRIIAQQLSVIQKQNIRTEWLSFILAGHDPRDLESRYIDYNGGIREVKFPNTSVTPADVRRRVEDRRTREAFEKIPLGNLGIEIVEEDE